MHVRRATLKMSSVLDFGPIYTSTGSISQVEYATKCSSSGGTIIFIKSSNGIVIGVEKPTESKLILDKMNRRVLKVTDGVFMAYTGLLSDGVFVYNAVKDRIISHIRSFGALIGPRHLQASISTILSNSTRNFSSRPIGCCFVIGMHNNGRYKVMISEPSSKTRFYNAGVVGRGVAIAKTKLESIGSFNGMSIDEMAEHIVKLLYMAHDPLSEHNSTEGDGFSIELCYMGGDDDPMEIREYPEEKLNVLVQRYRGCMVD